jgi:hypothetical protein
MNKKLHKDFNELLEKAIDPTLFPLQKNDKIYIGNSYLKKISNGFVIYDNKKCKKGMTKSKLAAIAFLKTLNKKNSMKPLEIYRLDKILTNNLNDCVYFKNILRKTSDNERFSCIEIRLDAAENKIIEIKEKLESFIFS